jgi:TRAP transporter TAXI family solute receptor
MAHNAELKLATEGSAPFKAPITDLRALANLYNWAPMQVIASKAFADKYGIKTFEDIAAKKPPVRVALNKRGNIAEGVAEQMFQAIGVPLADIKKCGGQVIYAASAEQSDLMKDRRADLLVNSLFVRHGSLLELEQSVDVVLLPLSEQTIAKVSQAAGIDSYVIKAGSYKSQSTPVPTVTLSAGIVVNAAMDDQTAYNLTKALVENVDKIKAVHKEMAALTPQIMTSRNAIPYHPGALRYYKEAGLLK